MQLFAKQGFSGTSTREIARLADVNEATLFRHFATKQELFWTSLETAIQAVRVKRELTDALQSGGDPASVVPMVVEFAVNLVLYQPEVARLLYFGILELEAAAEPLCRRRLGPSFELVRSYMERCIAQNTIRGLDPGFAVAAVLTSVIAHQGMYRLLTGSAVPYRSAQEAIQAYSSFWSAALRVSNSNASPA